MYMYALVILQYILITSCRHVVGTDMQPSTSIRYQNENFNTAPRFFLASLDLEDVPDS